MYRSCLVISALCAAQFLLFPASARAQPKPQASWRADDVAVNSLVFAPDSKYLITAGNDKRVKVWAIATQKKRRELTGSTKFLLAVAVSGDGETVASAGTDQVVRLWDFAGGKERVALEGHEKTVTSLAFSPDGKTLASGAEDKAVRLWDVSGAKEKLHLKGHTWFVSAVAFSPDGKLLASGGGNPFRDDCPGEIKLWDAATGREEATLKSHVVTGLAFTPDGKTLVSCGGMPVKPGNGEIRLWDVAKRTEVALQPVNATVSSVSVSRDGKYLACGCFDNTVRLFELESRKQVATLSGHRDFVNAVAFSPDGKLLASGSVDETVKLWELTTVLPSAK